MNRAAPILLTLVAMVSGCSRLGLGVKGDGVIKTEDRPATEFSSIEVSGAYEVQWTRGKPGLTITTDENILPLIRTEISDTTLKINSDQRFRTARNIVVILSSDSLADVDMSGVITFKASQVAADDLKLESSGASNITVGGAANKLEASLSGASRLNAHSLQAKSAILDLTGAANADVSVSETLEATVTGAGSVAYSGDPKSVEQHITGAGSVRRRP